MPVLAVPAVAAGLGMLMLRRRRRNAACRTAPVPTDLGIPTLGQGPDQSEVAESGR
ncbi:hypothetical protein [Streptomyces sp. NBC_00576]|uniref:hypothetical protein n=1 Tax=Streptomyces sp. NBC_00576 TaxID=2903665 RepID=UPI002E80C2A5|nr:hypothetical protein [Streptomyces sp. NBC_00576]WUB72904.1 hypothetical protein OG734_23915 [Streptomyces sp. NBC_00576]